MKQLTAAALVLLMVFAAGCSKDENPVDPPANSNPTFMSSNVKEGASFFSFDSKTAVDVWDVKFGAWEDPPAPGLVPQFLLNDEIVGNTNVRIYATAETSLDAVMDVNTEMLSKDENHDAQGSGWFNYNPATHQVSSKGLVYVVEAANGAIVKFRIDEYVQGTKDFTLSYATQKMDKSWSAPAQITLNISAGEQMVCFAAGKVITPAPWDIKLTVIIVSTSQGDFAYPGIVLNNAANVKAKMKDGTAFADVDPSTESGLSSDGQGNFVIGTECLAYDETTHRLSPHSDRVFVVQSIGGKRAKFQMLSYYNDDGLSGFMKFEYVIAQ